MDQTSDYEAVAQSGVRSDLTDLMELVGAAPSSQPQQQPGKRSRIVLSCAPCRASKLKCDRQEPCGQCLKKDRIDLCEYAPKPVKKRPAKGMSARLKRLEGMVREMMDVEGSVPILRERLSQDKPAPRAAEPHVHAQVVQGDGKSTYVGATHCMAMLEDIEDLKSYFDDSEGEDQDDAMATEDMSPPDVFIPNHNFGARTIEDLLSYLPPRMVADRLITRYFASMSPSQHVIHRPSFARAYAKFWQNPTDVSPHWLAQLFMVLGLGLHFNKWFNPTEVNGDSPMPPEDRVRQYRNCAGWALVQGKYLKPTMATLRGFLLYVESEFMFNRGAQMNCYVLSAVCIRLMLKMGLHRDASKLANISVFEGEMRRRMWNMATQVELLVSFHMGLPSMMTGIESDTNVPLNIQDDDIDEDSTELPPARSPNDYTAMTYPVQKTKIIRVFGEIARQAHALKPPSYAEVLQLDSRLNETWRNMPQFLKLQPLEDCAGETPTLLMHRFGLAALYNKSRCVLHRRYLAEAVPRPEHDYSRRQCLDAARALLTNQSIIWEATMPGHALSSNGWFISSLAVHDFLLSATMVYLVIRNESYGEPGSESHWVEEGATMPTKAELIAMMKRSHMIWTCIAITVGEVRKTAETLKTMLLKLGCSPEELAVAETVPPLSESNSTTDRSPPFSVPSGESGSMPTLNPFRTNSDFNSSSGFGTTPEGPVNGVPYSSAPADSVTAPPMDHLAQTLNQSMDAMGFMDVANTTNAMNTAGLQFDPSWMDASEVVDWRYLDVSLAASHDAGRDEERGRTWLERQPPMGNIDMGSMNGF